MSMRKVVVNSKYTYETDLDVNPGDIVLCPPGASGAAFEAVVTRLSSDYAGPCKRLLRIVSTDDPLAPFCTKISRDYYFLPGGVGRIRRPYELTGDAETPMFTAVGNDGHDEDIYSVGELLQWFYGSDTVWGVADIDKRTVVWRSIRPGDDYGPYFHAKRRLSETQALTLEFARRSNPLASMIERHLAGEDCGPMLLDYFQDFCRSVLTAY